MWISPLAGHADWSLSCCHTAVKDLSTNKPTNDKRPIFHALCALEQTHLEIGSLWRHKGQWRVSQIGINWPTPGARSAHCDRQVAALLWLLHFEMCGRYNNNKKINQTQPARLQSARRAFASTQWNEPLKVSGGASSHQAQSGRVSKEKRDALVKNATVFVLFFWCLTRRR